MKQTATYCPEDNKLRLYVGRVPREEYEKLRADGWTSTPKQECDFVATWTPSREDTALDYAEDGIIDDEDKSPADRAADRAERFSGYRDKREEEATGQADAYDSGPMLHGYQSAAMAERRAARHDRIATRAVNSWDKAEYWQMRTAGVISHALHVSTPGVRMGRIKELEAEIRGQEKNRAEYAAKYSRWSECSSMSDKEAQDKMARALAYVDSGCYDYVHPRTGRTSYLFDMCESDGLHHDPLNGAELCALWLSRHAAPGGEGRWLQHLRLRLSYELQMLEAQGGRAAFVEMEAGGWIGKYQIQRVIKSPATGRVTSVRILGVQDCSWKKNFGQVVEMLLNVERLKSEVYRAPTDEERAAFSESKKSAKKAAAKAKKEAPAAPSLVNPTNDDAERLQAVWNAQAVKEGDWDADKPKTVIYTTQASYSVNLKAGSAETYDITGGGNRSRSIWSRGDFPTVAKVRGSRRSVIVITDKPQKPFPAVVWEDPRPATRAEVISNIVMLYEAVTNCMPHYKENMTDEQRTLFGRACLVGLAQSHSSSQWGLTEDGYALAKAAGAFGKATEEIGETAERDNGQTTLAM